MGSVTKVYFEDGGDKLVVASGGELEVKSGGIISAGGTQGAAIVSLTDNSGGTAADTVAVIGATYDQAEVANAVASLAEKVNDLVARLEGAGLIAS